MATKKIAKPKKTGKPAQRAARKGRTKADKAAGAVKPGTRSKRKDAPMPGTQHKATKKQICIDLLSRPDGAGIEELQRATGWQAHSVRGFLAGTVKKKLGLELGSDKPDDGPRRYRILQGKA